MAGGIERRVGWKSIDFRTLRERDQQERCRHGRERGGQDEARGDGRLQRVELPRHDVHVRADGQPTASVSDSVGLMLP